MYKRQRGNKDNSSAYATNVYGNLPIKLGQDQILNDDLGIKLKGKVDNLDWLRGGSTISDSEVSRSLIGQRRI